MADHIHILISIKPNISISDLVRDIKANSSKWINENRYVAGKFQWQEGFGAFSYSKSQLDQVITYINNHEKHHQNKSFKDEYIQLLEKYGIEYDEKYLFEKGFSPILCVPCVSAVHSQTTPTKTL